MTGCFRPPPSALSRREVIRKKWSCSKNQISYISVVDFRSFLVPSPLLSSPLLSRHVISSPLLGLLSYHLISSHHLIPIPPSLSPSPPAELPERGVGLADAEERADAGRGSGGVHPRRQRRSRQDGPHFGRLRVSGASSLTPFVRYIGAGRPLLLSAGMICASQQ